MSTERDSHFAGFAKLLLGEIQSEYGGFVDVTPAMTQLETLIAQRAYDLVAHVVKIAPVTEWEWDMSDIPDMDKWSE